LDVERPSTTSTAVVTVAGYVAPLAGTPAVAFGAGGDADASGQPRAVHVHGDACSATAPPGTVRVTNCVTKRFKRHNSHVSARLHLTKGGRQLLSVQGSLAVRAAGAVTERHGSGSPLSALLSVVKSR
jgi:hypothetical protein